MRWASPRLIVRHSAAGMIRGTRSSGNGRSATARGSVSSVERDALAHEDGVAQSARRDEALGAEPLELGDSAAAYSRGAPQR